MNELYKVSNSATSRVVMVAASNVQDALLQAKQSYPGSFDGTDVEIVSLEGEKPFLQQLAEAFMPFVEGLTLEQYKNRAGDAYTTATPIVTVDQVRRAIEMVARYKLREDQ